MAQTNIIKRCATRPVTKQIEEFTDVYSFLFWQLGVKQ